VAPFILAQLSDLHVRAEDDGHQGAQRLAAVIDAVAALDPAPDAVLVTGDLGENGTLSEYERVARLLDGLRMPVHVLPGNHDDRSVMAEHFPGGSGEEPWSYAVVLGPLRLVACDTTMPGQDAGSLDGGRLEWLRDALEHERELPTVLAMHHPPISIGVGALDEIGLPGEDRVALGRLLGEHPQVARVVTGHVHTATLGSIGGREVFTCPSTCLPAELNLGETRPIELADGPPAFALHLLCEEGLVSHVRPVG
jgi:3',5'-cyclic-AMP phosphodiesterase